MKYLFSVPISALLSLACTGIIDGQSNSDRAAANPSPNQQLMDGGSSSTTTTTTTTTTAEPASPPFKVRNTEPELVPFEMRLRRVANTLGVSIDNPMFADMSKNSLKLGDYDYANGALPDGSWTANRIAAWLNALKPVCNSPEMQAKFPTLPESLPALIRAAWGHLPSADDSADFQSAIAATGGDALVNYESTCMAVFTAAEFVYR
jgi:hypothetical protein